MKMVTQDINELTDSREILESKPHTSIVIFMYILIIIIMIGFIWSYIGEIDVVVKAKGIVRPDKRISTINNMIPGKVENVYLQEGKKVKKGEILYTIEHSDLIIKKEFYEEGLSKKKIELQNLNRFKESISENKNYFDQENMQEKSYYDRYLKYKADQINITENINLIVSKILVAKDKIKNLEILLESIEKNTNLFENQESEYYTQYLDYKLKIKDLILIQNQKKRNFEIYKSLYEAEATSKIEYEKAKDDFEKSKLNLEKYEIEMKLILKTNLKEIEEKLLELQMDLKQTIPTEIENTQMHTDIASEYFKIETLISIYETIKQVEVEINQLENNLKLTNLDIKKCIVKAPINGYVNILMDINKGDNLLTDTVIATIVPDSANNYKMEIYVSNEDITNIKIGDQVMYKFPALPYNEYGKLTGKVINIAKDIKISQDNKDSFYLIEADIENKSFSSYKGEKVDIKIGMICEASIITETKKIIYYLLEKINLMN